MAYNLSNTIQFLATISGTQDFSFAQSYSLNPTPENAGAVSGKVYKYFAQDPNTGDWEKGSGVFTATGSVTFTLARTNIEWTSAENQNRFPFIAPPQVAIWLPAQNWLMSPLRGYIDGLNITTALGSFQVFPGAAADSTNYKVMVLASTIAKATGAWTAGNGNGGLDSGSFAANTWYWGFLIENETTQAVDVLFTAASNSLSYPAPTAMPSGYTLWRYIGSRKSNGTATGWVSVLQDGDLHQWGAPPMDYNTINNPGTAAVSRVVSTPLGVRTQGIFTLTVQNQGTLNQAAMMLLSDLNMADNAPSTANASAALYEGGLGATVYVTVGGILCLTDINSQIRTRMSYSDANIYFTLGTKGWIDPRGRNQPALSSG